MTIDLKQETRKHLTIGKGMASFRKNTENNNHILNLIRDAIPIEPETI